MRTIFDEGVPKGLEAHLPSHEVSTVKREGWQKVKNGKLLDLIEKSGFEAFITNDKRMEREQQFHRRPFAVLILSTNSWPIMEPHVGKIAEALDTARPGEITKVDCGVFIPRRFRNSQFQP